MAGAFYIWIMAAFLVGCVGTLVLLMGVFWIGHKLGRRRTGAAHGFLEVPPESQGRPVSSEALQPSAESHEAMPTDAG
jgi:hypothetical protein